MSVDLSRLKAYAPQARKDFRKAVTERAARIGITAGGIVEAQSQGDVVIVGGAAYDKTFGKQRDVLVSKVKNEGFDQVIEEIAYTWFNRLVALRFMELHGYLEHGFQIVGPGRTEGVLPEALVNAELLNLPRLSPDRVREMKIAGDYEEKLYRAILIAQCNALSGTMGFMFEKIGDATELLLPDNLLATDGLVRKLVWNSDATSWKDVEVIGWLYQFYISEKKDDVFKALKKNVKITAANIPAATQLFTPHWIVRYLVENSLGRLWLLNHPSSKLAEKMDYYIAPEEPETDFLNIESPEEIKICDPACGSGHMLTYAFDLLYTIYEEAGYRARDIPTLILEKNLYGIEIDDRAGALAAFSLTMKARAQDARIFARSVEPQICVLQDISFSDAEMQDAAAMVGKGLFTDELRKTLEQFEQAKDFGSLIVPKLRDPAETLRFVEAQDFGSDMLLKEVQERVVTVLRMAEALSPKYHVVVANPPYMGGKGMNTKLGDFLKEHFGDVKSDLFSAFMVRNTQLATCRGQLGFMTPFVWMFLPLYQNLRKFILNDKTISSLIQLEYSGFDGATVPICTFTIENSHRPDFKGGYIRLSDFKGAAIQSPKALEAIRNKDCGWFHRSTSADFERIPGSPIAYYLTEATYKAFSENFKIEDFGATCSGLQTSDNNRFLRHWFEVSSAASSFDAKSRIDAKESGRKWFPHKKGGPFRKWYGNNEFLLNWYNDGAELYEFAASLYGSPTRIIKNTDRYFTSGITWSHTTSYKFSARILENNSIFNVESPALFDVEPASFLCFLTSCAGNHLISISNPTLHFVSSSVGVLPFASDKIEPKLGGLNIVFSAAIDLSRSDWNAYETSWDFTTLPLLRPNHRAETLEATYTVLRTNWQRMTDEMQKLEEENNRIFIEAYGLQDELTPEVPLNEITLTCNPAYRYGVKGTEEEREELQQRDTMRELISYAIGCMMGRYSLVEPGLIYANAGNAGFDASRYGDFHADNDGIVPITDVEWFPDDATARFIEFLRQTFGDERLGENLDFVADSMEPKRKASASEAIRKYVSRSFYKDHLRTYKNRPIYWLFSSGKERAFECLVYLHRYDESTLGRMRAEYVIPLQTKMQNRIQMIEGEVSRGNLSSAQMKARTKELAGLEVKKRELDRFEANVRHMAEERITLDLDDGVKVNYGKFGDLLAETKLVCGTKDDD